MKILSLAAGLAFLFCATYGAAADSRAEPDAVRIRIANVSEVPFSETVITFPGHEENYGPLEPGRTSEYRSVSVAYPNPGYRIVADGTPYRAITVDHIGDTRLTEGAYTYTINVYGDRLIFGLMVDED